jgi:hypothetical protein
MKIINPPNAVDRCISNIVCPTSIPAMLKQRKIRINPRIIIHTRGHRKCSPYLLNVAVGLDLLDLKAIFTFIGFEINDTIMYDFLLFNKNKKV